MNPPSREMSRSVVASRPLADDHAYGGVADLASAPLGALGCGRWLRRRSSAAALSAPARTAIAAATSASSESSSGRWLTPPFRLRTKSIPASTPAAASTPASWPAPEVSSAIATAGRAAAARSARRTRSREPHRRGAPAADRASTPQPVAHRDLGGDAPAPPRRARRDHRRRARGRRPWHGTRPGMTFEAGPAMRTSPMVTTAPGISTRPVAQPKRELGARGEGVAALAHRHRPGVPGRAAEGHREAGHPGDGGRRPRAARRPRRAPGPARCAPRR